VRICEGLDLVRALLLSCHHGGRGRGTNWSERVLVLLSGAGPSADRWIFGCGRGWRRRRCRSGRVLALAAMEAMARA
jgi:hypothetical protein